VFDQAAALRVDEAVHCVKAGGELHLDLTRIRDFHDVGIAVLARTIIGSGERIRVDVRGLRHRQHQILRYLGVELAVSLAPTDDSLN
jgi:hypothetical protein